MNQLENFPTKNESKIENLNNLFGRNFNLEKTIELQSDVNHNNEEIELKDKKVFWTELKDPETGDVVEGKVYLPKDGKISKVLIVTPGYRGDFVLQENDYAQDFVKNGRMMIVLRHTGLRVEGEDVQNYIHCPDKQNKKDEYLGNDDFSLSSCNKEVGIALKSLIDNVDKLEKIDIVGHSLGGRTAINSIIELEKQSQDEKIKKLTQKIDNLIVIGAWLETRKEMLGPYLEYFKSEEAGNYFRNLNGENFFSEVLKSAEETKKITSSDFPKKIRFIGIHSVGDNDIDLEGEIFPFFEQIKDIERKGSIIVKDLKQIYPSKIGGGEVETHDYFCSPIREWIKTAIK